MLGEGEVGAAGDLDQREIRARIGADYLGGIDLAIVGRDLDLVGAVDHVVVGHGKAVRRDEKAGALALHDAATATLRAGEAIRPAEAAEEALHRRPRLERRRIVTVIVARG